MTRAAAGGERLDGGLVIRDVGYTPTSSGEEILKGVNLRLPPKGLNLIVGRGLHSSTFQLNLSRFLPQNTP